MKSTRAFRAAAFSALPTVNLDCFHPPNECVNVEATHFNAFGCLPDFHVTNGTAMVGAGIALLLSVASGFAPAYQAAKMPVVQALRRVE